MEEESNTETIQTNEATAMVTGKSGGSAKGFSAGNGGGNEHSNRESQSYAEEEEEEEEGLLFSCRCESARSVATLLSCLRRVSSGSNFADRRRAAATDDINRGGYGAGSSRSGAKAQIATVFAGPNALTFHVHGLAKQSQASVDMQAGLFSEYFVAEERIPVQNDNMDDGVDRSPTAEPRDSTPQNGSSDEYEVVYGGEFGINLTTVLECLHVLGVSSLDRTKLCLSYDRSTAIFKIELLENGGGATSSGGVLSTCAVPGVAVPDDEFDLPSSNAGRAQPEISSRSLAGAFRSDPVVARAIVKSDYLRDAISEIGDVAGATSVTVGISPSSMEWATAGNISECCVSLPKTSANARVLVSLECQPARLHARSYPLHSVLSAMRGLEIGTETCISINARGMIAIQHQVLDTIGNGQPNFVDFIMACLQEEEEDEEDAEAEHEEPEPARIDAAADPQRNHPEESEEPQEEIGSEHEQKAKAAAIAVQHLERTVVDLVGEDSGSETEEESTLPPPPSPMQALSYEAAGRHRPLTPRERQEERRRKQQQRRKMTEENDESSANKSKAEVSSSSRSPLSSTSSRRRTQSKIVDRSNDITDHQQAQESVGLLPLPPSRGSPGFAGNTSKSDYKNVTEQNLKNTGKKSASPQQQVSTPTVRASAQPTFDRDEEWQSQTQSGEYEDEEEDIVLDVNATTTGKNRGSLVDGSRRLSRRRQSLLERYDNDDDFDDDEDDVPSSPELMYDDTALEGDEKRTGRRRRRSFRNESASSDDYFKRPRRNPSRIGRSPNAKMS